MADRNQLKMTDPVDIAEDDPFAELTRIMGFDPRQKVAPQNPTKLGPLVEPGAYAATSRSAAAESAEPEFDIDLEKELLGELDVEFEAEAPVAAEPERVSAPEPAVVKPEPVFARPERLVAPVEPVRTAPQPQAAAPADAAVNELDFELAEGFDDAFAASVATDFEDDLAADLPVDMPAEDVSALEAELSPMPELEPVATAEPEAVAEPEPVVTRVERVPEPVDLFADDFDAAMADVDMDFTSDPIAPAPVAEEAEEIEDEPVAAEADDDIVLDDAAFADDFHIDLEDELGSFEPETIEAEAETVEQAAPEAVEAEVEEFEPVAAAPAAPEPVAEEPVFERFDVDAELERLLRRGAEPIHSAPAVEAEPEPVDATADEFSLGFDEQELLAATEEAARAQAADHEADDYYEAEDELDIRLGEEPAEDEIRLDADDAEDDVPDFDHDDFEAALARGLETAQPARPGFHSAQAAGSEDHTMQFSAPPASKRDPLEEIAELTEKYSAPLPKTFSRANPVAAQPQMSARSFRDDPVVRQDFARTPYATAPASGYRQANYDDIPEIETVEVADRPIAIEDDLDIPDLSFDDDVPPVSDYDDLDAEFASLLTDLNGPAPAPQRADPPVARMPAADPFELDTPRRAGAQAAPAPQAEDDGDYDAPPLAGSYDFDIDDLPGSRSPSANYAADDYDLGSDLDDGLPSAGASTAAMAEARSSSPRRGMLIAAIVGGVALVGGVGAFALSFGGSGDDVPVIVKADDQPIKVKPANPGGTTVPNQDNKVYDTVAGADATAAPQQEKLVTTTEEPIDVTPQEEPDAEAALADGGPALDEGADIEASSEEAAQGKGEDRISQIVAENAGDTDAEITAVAPRKVRTLVVKPDGTLMPREEPVAEAAPVEAAAETQAEAPVEQEMAAAAPAEDMTQPVTEEAAPAYTPPAAEKPVQVKKRQAAKAAPAPAAEETVASAEPTPALAPAQTSGEITSAMPEVVPIAPQRPAEQPVDVVGEVKPDQVAAVSGASTRNGSWAMQIASQPSEAAAQSSYQDLARRYGGVLAGHEVNIVKAEIAGKGTFWRVRVPAGSRNEAVSLCENYKAAGGNCFVSR